MEVWSNGSLLFVEQEHMGTTDCVTGLHISRLPGKHQSRMCMESSTALFCSWRTWRDCDTTDLAGGHKLQVGEWRRNHKRCPNISRSCSQPRKHHWLSGHIDVVLLILFLLLCIKPIFLCHSKTVELWRGKARHWRRGLGNRYVTGISFRKKNDGKCLTKESWKKKRQMEVKYCGSMMQHFIRINFLTKSSSLI